jgi:hypothetical protein
MEGMEVIETFLRKQALIVKWAEGILGYELNAGDLWEQLKSGVDLCRLMLKLKEGYVSSNSTHNYAEWWLLELPRRVHMSTHEKRKL